MTTVTRRIHFAVKGRRKRAIPGAAPERAEPRGRTPRIAKLMALAIRFDRLLQEGTVANQSELARFARVSQPRMTQIMNLLHLAPDIQQEILFLPPMLAGRDRIHERMLREVVGCVDWSEQRRRWRQLRERVYAEPASLS